MGTEHPDIDGGKKSPTMKFKFQMELDIGPADFTDWSPARIDLFFEGLVKILKATGDNKSFFTLLMNELPKYNPQWPDEEKAKWRKKLDAFINAGEVVDEIIPGSP